MRRCLSLIGLLVLVSLSTGCAATLVSATQDAVTLSEKLKCNGTVIVPGCITQDQFQRTNGVLNTLVNQEISYVAGSKTAASVVTMAAALVDAMNQIQSILATNAQTVIADLQKALGKL